MSDSPGTPSFSLEQRLCVDLQGPPVVKLEGDIISIRFSENLARCKLLEVSVNNWDPGSSSYKYSDGNLVRIGAGISLYSGDVILADGTIATLAPSFPDGSTPTLMFTADARHPPQNARQRVLRTALALSYGRELKDFHPVLRDTAKLARPRIDATGIVAGLATLKAGATVKIDGVGTAFSGEYSVTETTHTFDSQSGYLTSFVCSREQRHRRGARPRRV
jgi:hypothetical protein